MKKFVVSFLTVVAILSLSISVLAAPGAFVKSPSANIAPELIESEAISEECVATLKIVAYADRDQLSEDVRLKLEEAYNQIANHTKDSAYTAVVKQIAKEKNIDVSELSVSDLFDISAWNCEQHETHEGFVITLKSETLANLVAVIHYNGTSWDILEINELDTESGIVTFTTNSLSPFAFVVDNNPGNNSEPSPANVWGYVGIGIALVAIALLVLLVIKRRKNDKKTEQE